MRTLFLLIILFNQTVFAQEQPIKNVRFLSDVESFTPGESFRIGVEFEINPEWHIYWSYPGNFGLPTEFKLDLPEGVSQSEWYYPVPEKFKQVRDLQGYGYSKKVMFISDILTDQNYNQNLELDLEAKWLSCGKSQCIPGKKKFKQSISNAKNATLINQETFSNYLVQIPGNIEDEDSIVRIDKIEKTDHSIEITLEWQYLPDTFEIFPGLKAGTKVQDISLTNNELFTEYKLSLGLTQDFFILIQYQANGKNITKKALLRF